MKEGQRPLVCTIETETELAPGDEGGMDMKLNVFKTANFRSTPSSRSGARKLVGLALLFAIVSARAAGGELLVTPGAVWSYLDDGSDPGVAWREAAFDDSSWR